MLTDSIKKRREESRKCGALGDHSRAEEGRAGHDLQKKAQQQQQQQQQKVTKMNVCSKRVLRTSFDLFLYATGKSYQHYNYIAYLPTHLSLYIGDV